MREMVNWKKVFIEKGRWCGWVWLIIAIIWLIVALNSI